MLYYYYYYYSYYSHQKQKNAVFLPFSLDATASSATTALTIKMQEGEIENKESL